ncbi:MAG: hypothetical protein NT151_04830 [Acidobacteria bacterium]|nr:hypothetical protein [Acidobacteriota bacterium]
MKKWAGAVLFVLAIGVLASGCADSSTSTPTSPSAINSTLASGALTIGSLSAGTWTSFSVDPLGGVILNPGTCGNFKWSVTSLTLVSATGTFAADCGGGLSLAGNATASLNGTSAVWSAAGDVAGSLTCQFVVTGTAALENGGVRVTYNATVCGISITGSELLTKR